MKYLRLLSILFLIFIYGCENSVSEKQEEKVNEVEPQIQRKVEIFENSQLLKSVEYTVKIDKLNFSIQAGLRSDSTVALKFNYYHPLNFEEHLKYQEMLMDSAVKDFKRYKFKSVFLGRLIYTGDFCLGVTEEVKNENWDGNSYPELKEILDSGIVVQSFESLFKKYDMNIKETSFEKAFIIEGQRISEYAKISTPEENLPPEILDAMFWLILE